MLKTNITKTIFLIAEISFAVLAMQLPLVACSPLQSQPAQQSPENTSDFPMLSIPFENFDVGYTPLEEGFSQESRALLFRSEQEWQDFLNMDSVPDLVNFDEKMVLAVASISRPTGGYSIQINTIESLQTAGGQQWKIYYTENIPGSNCLVTQQPTNPTTFVIVDQANVTIELIPTQVEYTCSG